MRTKAGNVPSYNPLEHIILRTEVGSTAYGTGLEGHEDLDHMAVCVETVEQTIGLERFEHLIHRPGRGPQDPSGPGDLDLTVYSVRKWARLALKGNPSVLMLLFGKPIFSNSWGRSLFKLAPLFATEETLRAYRGYMKSQRERMTGTRGAAGRVRRNPGTDGGVDWKYAMHYLRLGYQGLDYLSDGHIQVPIPEPRRSFLVEVRQGRISLESVLYVGEDLEKGLARMEGKLPPVASIFETVQDTVIAIHQDYWDDSVHYWDDDRM